MGYGSRALQALNSYYSGELYNFDDAERQEDYPDVTAIDAVRYIFFRDDLYLNFI